MPHTSGIPNDPTVLHQVQNVLHRGLSLFDRHSNETARVGHDRKEREVATLFAQLTPAQSLALSKRLAINAPDDPLAVAFGRMLVDRRNRLIAFLERLRRGR